MSRMNEQSSKKVGGLPSKFLNDRNIKKEGKNMPGGKPKVHKTKKG
jgi:hypothetical protein